MWCDMMWCHAMSCHISWCCIMLWHIISCYIMWCYMISYVMWCHVISGDVMCVMSCHVLSCDVILLWHFLSVSFLGQTISFILFFATNILQCPPPLPQEVISILKTCGGSRGWMGCPPHTTILHVFPSPFLSEAFICWTTPHENPGSTSARLPFNQICMKTPFLCQS